MIGLLSPLLSLALSVAVGTGLPGNCTGCDFANRDLQNADLSNVNYVGRRLRRRGLARCELHRREPRRRRFRRSQAPRRALCRSKAGRHRSSPCRHRPRRCRPSRPLSRLHRVRRARGPVGRARSIGRVDGRHRSCRCASARACVWPGANIMGVDFRDADLRDADLSRRETLLVRQPRRASVAPISAGQISTAPTCAAR